MSDVTGHYIQLFNIHGLIRGNNLELGRDADTGGQTKYVLELAKTLSKSDKVRKVEIVTRQINDKKVADSYSNKLEELNEKLKIVRIRCGGSKYIRKEMLWEFLEEFVDKMIKYLKAQNELPDVIHSHYGDAGYVCTQLTRFFGIPFLHTGHSLGRFKLKSLINDGYSKSEVVKKYNIIRRINAEEETIFYADRIITSTNEEIKKQYGLYKNSTKEKFDVIPPGIELDRFYPYNLKREWSEEEKIIRSGLKEELWRFFTNMNKPLILALCRPERIKNIPGLIQAFGESKELREKSNLAIYAGIRRDIKKMPDIVREILTDMLLLMDKYNLYGKMAIPKQNYMNEIPELYRIAAETKGVFVNSGFTENFGITLIEAAASGLPVVATDDGGPRDIIENLNNGILVDVKDPDNISAAVNKILNSDKMWASFSKSGSAKVHNHYSWDAHLKNYLDVVEKLLDERRIEPKTFIETGRKFLNYKKLIILDIDDTITGNEKAYLNLKELLQHMSCDIGFGAATGRSIDSAVQIMKEINFIMPDVIISSVGSEIYYRSGEDYVYSTSWEAHIKNSWRPDKIKELLFNIPYLKMQSPENLRDYKVSYNFEGEENNIEQVRELLRVNKIKCNLILSHNIFVDLLPYRASKGRAVRYLSYRWNIPLDSILVGGDSGNDEDMLTGELLGIVVENHSRELGKLKGRRRVYFAENKYAAGITEGIKYYNFVD